MCSLYGVGHLSKPCFVQVTHTSDYFQELYALAVKLIKAGKAYVDHQTATEMKLFRCAKSYYLSEISVLRSKRLSC